MARRHMLAWCAVSVMVATVLIQWAISAINGPALQNADASGPGFTYTSPIRTMTPTPTATPTPKRSTGHPSRPPHIAVPVASPARRPPATHVHKPKPRPRTGPPAARITAPGPGTTVSGQPGVLMEGTASHLGSRKLEIFDYAPNNVYYLASDHGAVPVSGGHWSFQDATIGDGSNDVGKAFTLTAVIADTTCQATLRTTPRDAQNNISYPTLPSGCRNADHVRVVKTAP